MFRIKEDDISNLYYVTSADWESMVIATSSDRAVSEAFEEIYEVLGDKINLSPAIIAVDLTNFVLTYSEDHVKVYSTSMVLSDIGLHDLAKKFKKIIPDS